MMTQFKILMFLFILNVSSFVVMNAATASGDPLVPGAQYSRPINDTGLTEQAEAQFNATEMIEEWDTSPEIGIPLFGDIYYVAVSFVSKMRFLFDGFGMTMDWAGSFISSSGGFNALNAIGLIIRAIGVIMVATLVFEVISGRRFLP